MAKVKHLGSNGSLSLSRSGYKITSLPAGTAVAPPAWSPSSLTLVAWFRADTYNGSTQWNDGSPNAYNATLVGAGAAPTLVTGVINGQPVVRFAGGKTFAFAGSNTLVTPTTAFTLVLVTKVTLLASSTYNGLIYLRTGASSFLTYLLLDFAGYQPFTIGGGNGAASGNGLGIAAYDYSTGFGALTINYDGTNGFNTVAKYSGDKSGAAQTFAANTQPTNTSSGISGIGDFGVAGGGSLVGDIAEIIVATSVSVPDAASLRTYLNTRYGL